MGVPIGETHCHGSNSTTCFILYLGGFPCILHNELRKITAELLTETSSNVLIEPCLQPLTWEHLSHKSSNTEDNAQVDIATSNVWSPSDRAFFMLGFIIHFPPPTLD